MSTPLISRLSTYVPYLAVFMIGASFVFPSREIRTVRTLRADFDSLRADYHTLRDDFAATLSFIRDFDWSSLVGVEGLPGVDAPDGAPRPGSLVAPDCSYTRCHGVDGVRRGSDTWLVGDSSPWGVLSASYRGGFVADGVSYSCFPLTSTDGVFNDK